MDIRLRDKSEAIIDFDGVIVDSNNFKRDCIYQATKQYVGSEKAKEFAKNAEKMVKK